MDPVANHTFVQTHLGKCDGTSIHYHEGLLQLALVQEAAENNPAETT